MVDFIASLVIGVLAGLGVGSGGLFLMYLTLFCGVSHKIAQGINLLFFLFALAGSLMIHITRRRFPSLLMAVILGAGLPGTVVGSLLVHHLPVALLKRIFGVLLILAGTLTLFFKKRTHHEGEKRE